MNTLDFIRRRYNLKGTEPFYKIGYSRHFEMPKLFRRLGFTKGAEIGVAEGFFSERLCQLMPELKLYSVDPWENYPEYLDYHGINLEEKYQLAKIRLKPYTCEIIRKYSMDAVKDFADESLDFVYIDAAHDFNHVYEDIRAWHQKVKKGGIVAGHDWGKRKNYGVVKAVTRWMARRHISPLIIFAKEWYPSWLYVK